MLKFLNIVYSHRWDLKDLAERFLVFLVFFWGGGSGKHIIFFKAEFLDEIYTKVLRVFLLAVHSRLYNFALRFLLLQTHTTSNSF